VDHLQAEIELHCQCDVDAGTKTRTHVYVYVSIGNWKCLCLHKHVQLLKDTIRIRVYHIGQCLGPQALYISTGNGHMASL
jgi:hypothetical protein